MFRRLMAIVAFGAVCAAAGQASAQTEGGGEAGGPRLVTSFDCPSAIRPDQIMICSSPQLAAMDVQMATLFTVVQKFVATDELGDLKANQQEFLNVRAGCGGEFRCIGNAYAERIGELGALVNQAAQALDGVRAEKSAK